MWMTDAISTVSLGRRRMVMKLKQSAHDMIISIFVIVIVSCVVVDC